MRSLTFSLVMDVCSGVWSHYFKTMSALATHVNYHYYMVIASSLCVFVPLCLRQKEEDLQQYLQLPVLMRHCLTSLCLFL